MQNALDYLSAKDPILAMILSKHGNPIIQYREEGFAAMCHIILEQQVSIASAKAAYDKLVNKFDKIEPHLILHADEHDLKSCGISRQKIIYLKDLSYKVIAEEIDFYSFSQKSEQQIRNELIKIKGVGNWSIEVYLMFCLQSPDIIPLGDIAIKTTLKELYHCQSDDEMIELSNNWKPFRTIATYIVWHYYLKKRGKI
jgi:DNA-3-methyladenine glycosylase II